MADAKTVAKMVLGYLKHDLSVIFSYYERSLPYTKDAGFKAKVDQAKACFGDMKTYLESKTEASSER